MGTTAFPSQIYLVRAATRARRSNPHETDRVACAVIVYSEATFKTMTIAITIGGTREQPPTVPNLRTIGKWGSDSSQIGARVSILILGTGAFGWIPQTHQQIVPRACSSERAAGGPPLHCCPRAAGPAHDGTPRGRIR
jgi:hypothetical protein